MNVQKEKLEAKLADPATYSNAEEFKKTESAYKQVLEKLGSTNKQYEEVFEKFGMRRDSGIKFVTEAEHVHSSSDKYAQRFEELTMSLGMDGGR